MNVRKNKAFAVLILLRLRKTSRSRKMYIRGLFEKRNQGEILLHKELKEDLFYHDKYYRMNLHSLEALMPAIGPHLHSKQNHRYPISLKARLALTLRYLASGNSQISLAMSYRVSPAFVSQTIPQVLDALWISLKGEHLPLPNFIEIAEDFWLKWNMPHCIGAFDGKHVRIVQPSNSGSLFYNYKKYFSIVLMASADATYRFSVIEVGAYGSEGDNSIFSNSTFGKKLEKGELVIPNPKPFPGSFTYAVQKIPHVFVADEAFPLKSYIMRPYPGTNLSIGQRVFNYRLSRARRVVENAFGIMSAKFRILHTAINAKVETVEKITRVVCLLHNFLINTNGLHTDAVDCEESEKTRRATWRDAIVGSSGVQNFSKNKAHNSHTKQASEIRELFKLFFLSKGGSVPYQLEMINK